jgi:hypothetical protein
MKQVVVDKASNPDSIDLICFFVISVIAYFVQNIKDDQDATGHSDGQAEDVYKGKSLMF